MAAANCMRCNGTRFELEEAQVGRVVSGGVHVHLLGFTLFKCANCGAVLGVIEGGMVSIAKRQGARIM